MDKTIFAPAAKKACTGMLVFAICAILHGFLAIVPVLGSLLALGEACGIILFLGGLHTVKKAVDTPAAKAAVRTLLIGHAIILGSLLFDAVSTSVLSTVIAVLLLLGYKDLKAEEGFSAGANLNFVGAIILLVGAIFTWIPLAGDIVALILSIVAYILFIIGWSKIAKA